VSPDGHRAVMTTFGRHSEIRAQLLDLERGTRAPVGDPRQVTFGGAWSSDSEALALSAVMGGQFQLAWIRARAGETARALTTSLGMEEVLGDFTPDGRSILFEQRSNVDKRGVFGWMGNDELYWEDSDEKVGVATIRARGNDLDIGSRRPLFGGRVMHDLSVYDYSPARQRFLVSRSAGPPPNPKLVLVSDWRTALGPGGRN
jgi:Tol biopolymer transport system component